MLATSHIGVELLCFKTSDTCSDRVFSAAVLVTAQLAALTVREFVLSSLVPKPVEIPAVETFTR